MFTPVLEKKPPTVGEFQLVELMSETRSSQRVDPPWLYICRASLFSALETTVEIWPNYFRYRYA